MSSLKCKILLICAYVLGQEDLTAMLYFHDFHNVDKRSVYVIKLYGQTTSLVLFEVSEIVFSTSTRSILPNILESVL